LLSYEKRVAPLSWDQFGHQALLFFQFGDAEVDLVPGELVDRDAADDLRARAVSANRKSRNQSGVDAVLSA